MLNEYSSPGLLTWLAILLLKALKLKRKIYVKYRGSSGTQVCQYAKSSVIIASFKKINDIFKQMQNKKKRR